MNYFINTYGCQMNIHESEKVAGVLEQLGYQECNSEVEADIIVFNTCCIRHTAESKIYGHIGQTKKLKQKNPNLIIVILGCMTQQVDVPKKIKESYPYVDIILGTTNLDKLESAIVEKLKGKVKTSYTDFSLSIDETLPIARTSFPNAWVNIIYGCNNFCTYCIVPYVRGRERSRKIEDILQNIESLLSEGYKEITLLGQNVNSYGKDLQDGTTFAKLLEEIGKLEGKFRLRFMTSHPKDLTDDVIEAIAKHQNICNYIHLPIQSGSNKVLQDMNRKYTREQYFALVDRIRSRIPDVGITTDIMVGFPTETEEDLLDTLDLVEKVNFSSAFCFIYSPRSKTPAAEMPQLPYKEKQARISRLLATQNVVTKKLSNEMIGNVFEVLVEDINKKHENTYCGRTESGRLVNFKSESDVVGEFVMVKVTTAKSATLWGEKV